MSIAINGMEMPINCTHCPCSSDETRFCNAANKYIPMLGKPKFCPLETIEERKTGKWIDTTQGDHYKCSCCGTRAAFWFNEENSSGWERDMSEWLSDYCPNCGARMEDEA